MEGDEEIDRLEDNSVCIIERYETEIEICKSKINQRIEEIRSLNHQIQLIKIESRKYTLLLKEAKIKQIKVGNLYI